MVSSNPFTRPRVPLFFRRTRLGFDSAGSSCDASCSFLTADRGLRPHPPCLLSFCDFWTSSFGRSLRAQRFVEDLHRIIFRPPCRETRFFFSLILSYLLPSYPLRALRTPFDDVPVAGGFPPRVLSRSCICARYSVPSQRISNHSKPP